MYKNLFTLLIFLLAITSNSQNIVLLKNFNPKAKELKHNLNRTRDSLVLASDQIISKVELFNENFEKKVKVENSEVKISLHNIPIGEFHVEVHLEGKIIIMELIKYSNDPNSSISSNESEFVYEKGTMLDENLNPINVIITDRIESLLSPKKRKSDTKKKLFWVILKSSSSKTMKLVDETTVKKMIKKNKLELNSAEGKSNELTVWEVYDSHKFMEAQIADTDYINSTSSDLFNVIPYYSSLKSLVASK
ncbi:hypothetical protein [Winogradskyella sp.]|uniref:hypothetical protein n=1 Tax=Winogradskyella sp. TaxID=1883156 RepID=UPI00260F78D4|nr:hypothetical protein [Winogradskyella sp.]